MDPNESFSRLYSALTLMELRMFHSGCGDGRLSYNDVLYLTLVRSIPECTAGRMAEAIGVSKSAVTLKLNSLEDRGLVMRVRKESDRRVVLVMLPDDVEEVFRYEDTRMGESIRGMEEAFSQDEVDLFCRMMDHVTGMLEDGIVREQCRAEESDSCL